MKGKGKNERGYNDREKERLKKIKWTYLNLYYTNVDKVARDVKMVKRTGNL